MPSDKHNLIAVKATGLIFMLFDIASAQEVYQQRNHVPTNSEDANHLIEPSIEQKSSQNGTLF